jgi:hypothetical protein
MQKDSREEIRLKIKAIKKIYSDYLDELAELKEEQRKIIYKFIKEEEQKRIKEIRNNLNKK